jgi:hypothetical protein
MTLAEFRKTRQNLPIHTAIELLPFLAEMDLSEEYTHAIVYNEGFYILQSRRGFYLEIESDEYETRDLALLEFLLWQWSEDDNLELTAIRNTIWGES